MSLSTDTEFHWKGFGNRFGKWDSCCRIRIYQSHPEAIVVVVSAQGEDTGTSITNCAAELATLVVREFDLNPSLLSWIEHYPGSDVEFSRVEFDWQGVVACRPRWAYLTPEQAKTLIGGEV